MNSDHGQKTTRIERGTKICGALKASVPVVIDGQFEGQVEAPELTITDAAIVQGTMRATRLDSSGTVAGSLEAEELALSGRVLPDTKIRTDSLLVRTTPDGAPIEVILGACVIEAGTDPYARRKELIFDCESALPQPLTNTMRALPADTGKDGETEEAERQRP